MSGIILQRNVIRHSFSPKQDPTASPVGISRYVPQKVGATAGQAAPVSPQNQRRKDAVNHPTSSSSTVVPPSARLPSISHPRVITKAAPAVDTSIPHPPLPRGGAATRVKCTRSSDRNKRGSPSSTLRTEVSTNESEPVSLSTSHAHTVSAVPTPATSRPSWRDVHHRASPVPDSRQSLTSDDVQIHEISSSSESNKSEDHYGSSSRGRRGIKRKAGQPIAASSSQKKKTRKEPESSIEMRPRITRNSISDSPLLQSRSPIPSTSAAASGATRHQTTKPPPNKKKTAAVKAKPKLTTLQIIKAKAKMGKKVVNPKPVSRVLKVNL